MARELTYLILTDKIIRKSLTGNVLFLAPSDLSVKAAAILVPSHEPIRRFYNTISPHPEKPEITEAYKEWLIREYVDNNPNCNKRLLFILLEGEDARKKLESQVGDISKLTEEGLKIRGRFGDVRKEGNKIVIEDPAAIIIPSYISEKSAKEKIVLWAGYSKKHSGVFERIADTDSRSQGEHETTLALIKPEIFQKGLKAIGQMISIYDEVAKYIIGAKVVRMDKETAEKFYSHIEGGMSSDKFKEVVCYMAQYCLALIFRGRNAITDIKTKLGATDPNKAAIDTVRRLFGTGIRMNAGHASDSIESSIFERILLGMYEGEITKQMAVQYPKLREFAGKTFRYENDIAKIVRDHYA